MPIDRSNTAVSALAGEVTGVRGNRTVSLVGTSYNFGRASDRLVRRCVHSMYLSRATPAGNFRCRRYRGE